jgi:hypothetical protein
MKYFFSGIMLAALALFAACGSNSNNGNNNVNVAGNWSAALTDTGGNAVLSFTTTLTQTSNNSVSGETLTFTTNSACFANGETETGALTINGTTNGVTSAGLQLSIVSSGASAGNTLMLNGTFQNNAINGTWTLTGTTGCSGNGTFTMTKVSS